MSKVRILVLNCVWFAYVNGYRFIENKSANKKIFDHLILKISLIDKLIISTKFNIWNNNHLNESFNHVYRSVYDKNRVTSLHHSLFDMYTKFDKSSTIR